MCFSKDMLWKKQVSAKLAAIQHEMGQELCNSCKVRGSCKAKESSQPYLTFLCISVQHFYLLGVAQKYDKYKSVYLGI